MDVFYSASMSQPFRHFPPRPSWLNTLNDNKNDCPGLPTDSSHVWVTLGSNRPALFPRFSLVRYPPLSLWLASAGPCVVTTPGLSEQLVSCQSLTQDQKTGSWDPAVSDAMGAIRETIITGKNLSFHGSKWHTHSAAHADPIQGLNEWHLHHSFSHWVAVNGLDLGLCVVSRLGGGFMLWYSVHCHLNSGWHPLYRVSIQFSEGIIIPRGAELSLPWDPTDFMIIQLFLRPGSNFVSHLVMLSAVWGYWA